MSKRLRDYVVEGNQYDIENRLGEMIENITQITSWINDNIERTAKRVVLVNLLSSTSDYLELMKSSLESHISVIALSTRSIYEINIRVRSILELDDEMDKWQSEAVTDQIQTLEGILLLADDQNHATQVNILKSEMERLQNLLSKYNLPVIKNPVTTGSLAQKVGQESEHKSLFKLYSKLVHPSSLLVNNYQTAASIENQKTLQIHAQLYTFDTMSRICEALNVPSDTNPQ
ncbi:MAG: DUF5677 domain-containing protein [Anaerovoracaceae bacterium]